LNSSIVLDDIVLKPRVSPVVIDIKSLQDCYNAREPRGGSTIIAMGENPWNWHHANPTLKGVELFIQKFNL